MPPSPRPLTPEDVDRIAAIADPIIRNLTITQAYADLSATAAARLGPVANWCTYATWASKQAGATIRQEDLRRAIAASLGSSSTTRSADAVGDVATEARRLGSRLPLDAALAAIWATVDPAVALDRASDAVARGNLRVFEEIGREFARFEVVCGPDTGLDALDGFLEGLRPGEPPDGQRYLCQAWAHYGRARMEADPTIRAQLILLANLEIGFHEQVRLQPEIAAALEAGVVDPRTVRDRLIEVLFPHAAWLVRLRLSIARMLGRRSRLDVALDAIVAEQQRIVRRILTRHLMSIRLGPAVHLQLGEDLGVGFAPSLREIVLPELRELLERIDPTRDSPLESGAVDWGDLDERIHFIAEMFRCFAESPALFEPPFTPAQQERLRAGERPADPL